MKTLLVTLALAAATVGTARAEYYRPSIVRDSTIVGAVAGALIGGHNGDRWAQGALIGAAAGAVVG
ncbi:MAG TPA: glycine zipper domain-containing protein, partial [Opitutus sp.]|nr:glycine zipper domain-containing protein [Opitutus sp.]